MLDLGSGHRIFLTIVSSFSKQTAATEHSLCHAVLVKDTLTYNTWVQFLFWVNFIYPGRQKRATLISRGTLKTLGMISGIYFFAYIVVYKYEAQLLVWSAAVRRVSTRHFVLYYFVT